MNVWRPVELALVGGGASRVAGISVHQPPFQGADVSAEVGAGAAAEELGALEARARLAAHDRFALPGLRPRRAGRILSGEQSIESLVDEHVGEIQARHPRARRQGRHREDLPDARHVHRHAGDQPGVSRSASRSLFPGRDFAAVTDTLHNHGTSSIQHGRGAVLTIDLTNRCNMMCDPCFMDANQVGYVHELTLDDVKQLLDDAISVKPRRQMTVQFSGGEPTISPIFLDAVRYAREVGYFSVQAATNGIRFAQDAEFARAGARGRACASPTCSSTASARRPTPIARSATCST